ncbi:MAG: addiction module toxin RelE [Prevotella sp.]|nr:addiction module toxin RelE [Prevotella sp.]
MKVVFAVTDEFFRQFKRLAKKYPSLADDYESFKNDLRENPYQGSDLGGGAHKVRMAVAAKGKGKSGGARVITFNVYQQNDGTIKISLLTIYDKGEISSVSSRFIKWLVAQVKDK